MMFQGAYTDKFYHALHDALHAHVDSQNGAALSDKSSQKAALSKAQDLWNRVVALERTCRNSSPTVLPKSACDSLVQLQSQYSAGNESTLGGFES
jgi:hypothetical protein